MRIIYDIEKKASVTVGGRTYSKIVKPRPEKYAPGFHVSVTIITKTGEGESEDIHIEGNARYVLHALKEAVELIEEIGDSYAKDGEIRKNWSVIHKN